MGPNSLMVVYVDPLGDGGISRRDGPWTPTIPQWVLGPKWFKVQGLGFRVQGLGFRGHL